MGARSGYRVSILKRFSKASSVNWTYGEFVEATFLDSGVPKTAYYDDDNNLVGTTTDEDATALPEKARDHIIKVSRLYY